MSRVLTIDMGNGGLKAALFRDDKIEKRWRFKFDTGFEYVSEVLRNSSPEGVAVSSVVPEWTYSFLDKIDREKYKGVLYVDSKTEFPFPVLLSSDAEVGADRLCAACGSMQIGVKEAVIVDFGTAVTVDVLSRKGYEGGVIFPGAEIILNSLHRETAVLPFIRSLSGPGKMPGKDTREAISSGTFWGILGAVEKLIERSLETLSSDARIILTGGGISVISSHLKGSFLIEPDLVSKGLLMLYNMNM
ncbi:MAG TPA: type III pantothenate kinase [Candidatus Krumholzibacteriaceae bacterium]|nr:type III pantothenate kinase [Candidatus Krumholzibacteriaceae bacterium]